MSKHLRLLLAVEGGVGCEMTDLFDVNCCVNIVVRWSAGGLYLIIVGAERERRRVWRRRDHFVY